MDYEEFSRDLTRIEKMRDDGFLCQAMQNLQPLLEINDENILGDLAGQPQRLDHQLRQLARERVAACEAALDDLLQQATLTLPPNPQRKQIAISVAEFLELLHDDSDYAIEDWRDQANDIINDWRTNGLFACLAPDAANQDRSLQRKQRQIERQIDLLRRELSVQGVMEWVEHLWQEAKAEEQQARDANSIASYRNLTEFYYRPARDVLDSLRQTYPDEQRLSQRHAQAESRYRYYTKVSDAGSSAAQGEWVAALEQIEDVRDDQVIPQYDEKGNEIEGEFWTAGQAREVWGSKAREPVNEAVCIIIRNIENALEDHRPRAARLEWQKHEKLPAKVVDPQDQDDLTRLNDEINQALAQLEEAERLVDEARASLTEDIQQAWAIYLEAHRIAHRAEAVNSLRREIFSQLKSRLNQSLRDYKARFSNLKTYPTDQVLNEVLNLRDQIQPELNNSAFARPDDNEETVYRHEKDDQTILAPTRQALEELADRVRSASQGLPGLIRQLTDIQQLSPESARNALQAIKQNTPDYILDILHQPIQTQDLRIEAELNRDRWLKNLEDAMHNPEHDEVQRVIQTMRNLDDSDDLIKERLQALEHHLTYLNGEREYERHMYDKARQSFQAIPTAHDDYDAAQERLGDIQEIEDESHAFDSRLDQLEKLIRTDPRQAYDDLTDLMDEKIQMTTRHQNRRNALRRQASRDLTRLLKNDLSRIKRPAHLAENNRETLSTPEQVEQDLERLRELDPQSAARQENRLRPLLDYWEVHRAHEANPAVAYAENKGLFDQHLNNTQITSNLRRAFEELRDEAQSSYVSEQLERLSELAYDEARLKELHEALEERAAKSARNQNLNEGRLRVKLLLAQRPTTPRSDRHRYFEDASTLCDTLLSRTRQDETRQTLQALKRDLPKVAEAMTRIENGLENPDQKRTRQVLDLRQSYWEGVLHAHKDNAYFSLLTAWWDATRNQALQTLRVAVRTQKPQDSSNSVYLNLVGIILVLEPKDEDGRTFLDQMQNWENDLNDRVQKIEQNKTTAAHLHNTQSAKDIFASKMANDRLDQQIQEIETTQESVKALLEIPQNLRDVPELAKKVDGVGYRLDKMKTTLNECLADLRRLSQQLNDLRQTIQAEQVSPDGFVLSERNYEQLKASPYYAHPTVRELLQYFDNQKTLLEQLKDQLEQVREKTATHQYLSAWQTLAKIDEANRSAFALDKYLKRQPIRVRGRDFDNIPALRAELNHLSAQIRRIVELAAPFAFRSEKGRDLLLKSVADAGQIQPERPAIDWPAVKRTIEELINQGHFAQAQQQLALACCEGNDDVLSLDMCLFNLKQPVRCLIDIANREAETHLAPLDHRERAEQEREKANDEALIQASYERQYETLKSRNGQHEREILDWLRAQITTYETYWQEQQDLAEEIQQRQQGWDNGYERYLIGLENLREPLMQLATHKNNSRRARRQLQNALENVQLGYDQCRRNCPAHPEVLTEMLENPYWQWAQQLLPTTN